VFQTYWYRKSTHTFYVRKRFPENRASCEITWKNFVGRSRPQMAVWRIVWRIPKATNTHSQYIILIAFPTSKMAEWTLLNTTLYVHWLSCSFNFHCTGSFEITVGILITCHTQCTWDSSICIFLFNRTTLQVFVTYRTGALYVLPLWFYRVIRNDWRGFNNLSYSIHLRYQYIYFFI